NFVVDQTIRSVVLIRFRMACVVQLLLDILVAFAVVTVYKPGNTRAAVLVLEGYDPIIGVVAVFCRRSVPIYPRADKIVRSIRVLDDRRQTTVTNTAQPAAKIHLLCDRAATRIGELASTARNVVNVADRLTILHRLGHPVSTIVRECHQPPVAL